MNQFHLIRRALTLAYAALETAGRKDNFADNCENLERVHHETIPADKRESSASEYRPAGASRETRPRPAPIHCEGGENRGKALDGINRINGIGDDGERLTRRHGGHGGEKHSFADKGKGETARRKYNFADNGVTKCNLVTRTAEELRTTELKNTNPLAL